MTGWLSILDRALLRLLMLLSVYKTRRLSGWLLFIATKCFSAGLLDGDGGWCDLLDLFLIFIPLSIYSPLIRTGSEVRLERGRRGLIVCTAVDANFDLRLLRLLGGPTLLWLGLLGGFLPGILAIAEVVIVDHLDLDRF